MLLGFNHDILELDHTQHYKKHPYFQMKLHLPRLVSSSIGVVIEWIITV